MSYLVPRWIVCVRLAHDMIESVSLGVFPHIVRGGMLLGSVRYWRGISAATTAACWVAGSSLYLSPVVRVIESNNIVPSTSWAAAMG